MAMLSFGGIDVSKDRLDVMVLPEEQCSSVPNDAAGWADLVERLSGSSIAALWDRRIRSIFQRAEKSGPAGPQDIALVMGGISLTVGGWTSTAKALPNVNGFPLHALAANVDLLMRYDDPPPRALVVNLSARLRRFHEALDKHHLHEESKPTKPARKKR
jgi:hypothetical protein